MSEYRIVNADGVCIKERGNPFFIDPKLFAELVTYANTHAKLYGRPVRIMGHFSDASNHLKFQSELYVAQP